MTAHAHSAIAANSSQFFILLSISYQKIPLKILRKNALNQIIRYLRESYRVTYRLQRRFETMWCSVFEYTLRLLCSERTINILQINDLLFLFMPVLNDVHVANA
jgi:hypothetical protein